MKNVTRAVAWLTRLLLLAAIACPLQAASMDVNGKPETPKYRTPEDLLGMVPIVGDIPRSFIWGEGYKMHLGTDSLQIDHRGYNLHHSPKNCNCSVFLRYESPVAFFGTRMELPLLEGGSTNLNGWALTPLGSYTMRFMKNAPDHPSVTLNFVAHF